MMGRLKILRANPGSRGTFPGEPVAGGPPPTIPPTAVLTLRRSGLLVRGTLAKGEAGCLEEKVAAWLTDPKRERHRRRRPTPFLLSMPSALLPCRTRGLSELRRGTRVWEFFHCWVHQASARAGKHCAPVPAAAFLRPTPERCGSPGAGFMGDPMD
jgi:hypothetical protein